ncbi:MAG: hypothetical protein V4480_04625 [Patescibacteria group bacterium]
METPVASPTHPAHVPVSDSRKTRRTAIILVIAAIIIALAAYWAWMSPSAAFRGISYQAGSYENRDLHRIGWFGIRSVTLPVSGRVLDYARAGGSEAAIVLADDGSQDVYRIAGGKAQALTHDGGIKSSLAISQDGSMVAYAARSMASTSTEPADFYALDAWNVTRINTADGSATLAGKGYGPQFFAFEGSEYLAFTGPAGLHIVELATNTHQDLPVGTMHINGLYRAAISADGHYLALPSSDTYKEFSLSKADGVFSIAYIGRIPFGAMSVSYLKDDTVASLVATEAGNSITLSDPANPASIRSTKILPPGDSYKLAL